MPVSPARPKLSPGISQTTRQTTYEPFTPSKSGQRSHPTYYRGCWHVVSRCFFYHYRHQKGFVIVERGLQPEGRHPPRGVAASGLRPLCNIPHCCLPQESGPYLSPNVADHPLRPATRRRLGRPVPHQQTDRPRAHPIPQKAFHHTTHSAVLSGIRPSFPSLSRSTGQITHVLLTRSPLEHPTKAGPFRTTCMC